MDDRRPRTAIIQQYGVAGMADEIVRLRDEIDRLRKVPHQLLEELPESDEVTGRGIHIRAGETKALLRVIDRMGGTQPEEPKP